MPKRETLWRGAAPPGGPFTLNRLSAQAAGLQYWWPFTSPDLPDPVGQLVMTPTGSLALQPSPVTGRAFGTWTGSAGQYALVTGASLPTTGTATMWLYWVDGGAQDYQIFWDTLPTVGGLNWYHRNFLDAWGLYLNGTAIVDMDGGPNQTALISVIPSAQWTHVAITWTPTTQQVYVNGQVVGSFSVTLAGATDISTWYWGRIRTGDTYNWNGAIADSRIYNRPFSAAEVRQLYDPATRWNLYAPQRTRLWAAVVVPVQYVYPTGDFVTGGWTTDTGSSSNLFAAIDELFSAINDADYIQSPLAPNGAEAKVRLGTLAALATTHYQYVRAYNPIPNSKRVDLTITLYATNGTTVLDTTTITLTSTLTTYALPIASAADAATGLVLGVSATQVG